MIRTCLSAAAVAILLVSQASAASSLRPISHEDVWLMKRVGAPVVSPDGQWVVFSVTHPSYDENQQWSDLWIASTDGSVPLRRLTATRRGESGAAWSPDSRKIAFSTRREDDQIEQIYVIDVTRGGEAQRLTHVSGGAYAPRWRPDGGAILFLSNVFPSAKDDAENRKLIEERNGRKYNARVYETAPIRHWDRWLNELRPTLMVQALDGSESRNLLAGTRFLREPGFGGRLENEGDVLDAAWTPDGQAVVFTATLNRHEWAYADDVQSLWLIPANGGAEPRRLTEDTGSYRSPQFSRDGKALYAQFVPDTEKVYNARRIVRWSWPAFNDRRVVTEGFDRSADSYAVAPDGSRLYLLAEDSGRQKLYTVDVRRGGVREVGALRAGTYSGLTVGGSPRPVVIANWESAVSPDEVGRIDPATGTWVPLTRINQERIAHIDWQPLREFTFTSSRGHQIHNFLVLPPAFDPGKKYPLFVLIHGGPHTMWRDEFFVRWNYHLLAAPGYVVLMTNYSGSTGFGERFAQQIQGDPLEGPANEINEAADEAIRRFSFIDGSRQAAGGASYGGHLTNWLAVTTTRYKALISHAGLFDLKTQWSTSDSVYSRERNMSGPFWEDIPLWREQSPAYRSANLRTPMLVTIGERDYRVPMNNALELWTVLQRQKVPSRLVVFPDQNHWIMKGEDSRFFYSEVHNWLARYL